MRARAAQRSEPRRAESFLAWLAALQAARPGRALFTAGVVTALCLLLAGRLKVLTGFEHLLPEQRKSVQELARVAGKTAGISTLFLVLKAEEGGGAGATRALRAAGDALVIELAKLGSPWVGSVEDGVHEARGFLAPRAGLYVEREKLAQLRDEINARFEHEVAKKLGFVVDEEGAETLPPLDEDALARRLGVDLGDLSRFPDGYYQSKDLMTLVVAVRSKVLGGDLARGTEALRRVREVVDRVNPASFHPSIQVGWAGDLYSGVAEVEAIHRDLTEVGILGLALIGASVLLFYLRLRTLLLLLVTIVVGIVWTFGFAALAIGHLNLATGFLFTIVAGNGINPGIIYLARYLEARRDGAGLEGGLAMAHRETYRATFTACAAAGAAYASLLATEFRGFRDFGLIGGAGMLLCWLATYLSMPALIAVFERVAPLEPTSAGRLARLRRAFGGSLGRPIAALVARAPGPIVALGLALTAAGVAATIGYVRGDPMEYDMRNLRNKMTARAEESHNKELADEITGYVGADAMAILVDHPGQVPLLRAALHARRDAALPGQEPFKAIHALDDFVPQDQEAKIPLLLEIKDKLLRAQRRGMIGEEAWGRLIQVLPPDDLQPFTMADLPEAMARPFTEVDGTRGRIVYISPSGSTEDARYLFRWADAYRETVLPDGSVVLGSGRAVIYADMWTAVIGAIPLATLCSLIATALVVLAAFRCGRAAMSVLGALVVGVLWLGLLMAALGIKLTFLNFIALPITFGIGVDYAVNIVHRAEREGADGALRAVRETGGAVILCSLTTALGYIALVGSMNLAVRSLGIVAVLGELCCVVAAALVLPGALVLRSRRALGISAVAGCGQRETKSSCDGGTNCGEHGTSSIQARDRFVPKPDHAIEDG